MTRWWPTSRIGGPERRPPSGAANVSGGGRKPFKQKGTGQARARFHPVADLARRRRVLWPPSPHFGKRIPPKWRGWRSPRDQRQVAEGALVLVDEMTLSEPKTKLLLTLLKPLTGGKPCVVVVDKMEKNLALGPGISRGGSRSGDSLNTYQVLRYPLMLITQTRHGRTRSPLRK
jgi:large subunit ribosomal protein L4